jgi:site-specific DNA recombinase
MNRRAVIYARVSDDAQRDNYSIPTQIRDCLRIARERGYAIVGDQFVDPETGLDVRSSDTAIRAYVDDYTSRELNRPSLDAAFHYLERQGCDVVIVHAIDRLARDPYIRRTLEMDVERYGAKVEYVLGGYDETPEGEVRKDLDATFAKWETAKRMERVMRGKRGKATRGLFVAGNVPYGYRRDENAPGGLTVDGDEAAVVQWIFDLYVNQSYSVRAIADVLTKEQIVNHSGKMQWGKSSVSRILSNETYAGTNYFDKHARKGKRLVKRSREEWIAIPVTPIVERELFDMAQQKLAENREIKRQQPKRFYLLSGMIFCAKCGRVYASQTERAGKNRRVNDAQYYRHRVKLGHCMNKYISARELEADVWGTIVCAILDGDNLRKGYADSLEREEASRAKLTAHLETLERAAIKLEQKRDNLTRAYIDPEVGMSKAEYVKQKATIETELADLAEQIATTRDELFGAKPPADLETFDRFATKMRETLAQDIDPDPQEKRRIFEMLHIRVLIEPDGQHKVKGWFSPNGRRENTCLSSTTSS